MALAAGIAKQLRYKAESTFGTAPGASGAQVLRRTQSTIDLQKDTYQSNEIRSDYQVADFRHGVRRVSGSLNGELSPGTYKDFFAAALRKVFAAVSAITGLSITIAAGSLVGSVQLYTVTRASGSFLSDGVKVGDVIQLSAGSFNAANSTKNLFVVSLTATVATCMVLNGVAMVAEGPVASSTVTVVGKKTYVPTTGHTDTSFSIEHWYSDISQSELFTGCKVNTLDIGLPATGIATLGLGIVGQNITTSTSQYFTSPTAATTTGVEAAVNGALILQGSPIAIVTGASIKVEGGYAGNPVAGANTIPAIFPGRVRVSGQLTAYLQDATLRDYFINETEVALALALTADNTASAAFTAFSLPRVKVGGASKSDGEQGIVLTMPFTALYNSAGGTGTASEQTTIVVQDSAA